ASATRRLRLIENGRVFRLPRPPGFDEERRRILQGFIFRAFRRAPRRSGASQEHKLDAQWADSKVNDAITGIVRELAALGVWTGALHRRRGRSPPPDWTLYLAAFALALPPTGPSNLGAASACATGTARPRPRAPSPVKQEGPPCRCLVVLGPPRRPGAALLP
ncbi:unnamed protein product, partial [Amoebophrya sp. A120]